MRLLIFGASGYTGRELHRQAEAAGHRVTGTSFNSDVEGLVRVDIRDERAVVDLIESGRFDAAVNTAYVQSDWATTAVAPAQIANTCNSLGLRFVHVSSDAVFSGELAVYDEDCVPSPPTVYGAAKAAAEVGVAAAFADAAIVRTSWILGDGDSGFERFVRALAAGGTDGVLFDDDIRCPVHVADLAAVLLELAEMPAYSVGAGIVHAAGADAVSRYELGCLLAERDGLDAGALPKASKATVGAKGTTVRLESLRAPGLVKTRMRGARAFTTASSASRT